MRALIEETASMYSERTAYSFRVKPSDKEITKVTFPALRYDVRALASEFISRDLDGKHVAVIGKMTGMGDLFTDDIRLYSKLGTEFCYSSIGEIYKLMQEIPKDEIDDAMLYWIDAGLVVKDGEAPAPIVNEQPEPVREKTGLFVDNGYMYKILTGQRNAPRIVEAICEILNIEKPNVKE